MKIDVTKVARLANLPLTEKQTPALAAQFEETVAFVDNLKEVEVKNTPPTAQVTGSSNVFREDEIDSSRTFTQEKALKNASKTNNGFFVVKRLID